MKYRIISLSIWEQLEVDKPRRIKREEKKLVIEMIIYAVIVVIGIILMFTYQPEEQEIVIQKDYEIQWNGGDD